MKPIRVALVEDDPTVRNNLSEFIRGTSGFDCVAACTHAEEAHQCLPALAPDVVLVDINLPGQSGVEFVRQFREAHPATQVIMLTVEEDNMRVFESLKAGATGYLVKHVAPEEILLAIQEVHAGGAPMSSQIARMVVSMFHAPTPPPMTAATQLTARESEILRQLARGDRSKEIADKLNIGVGTVNTHIRHVYEKLHVRSRAEAVARFLQA